MNDEEVPEPQKDWHSLSADETVSALKSNRTEGLSHREAERRLREYGHNRLREANRRSTVIRFLAQFNDFMIWVLLAAVVISAAYLKEYMDALVIMVIVVLNAVMGFVQEARAEKAMEELKKLSAPTAKVRRGGAEKKIHAANLVPGDLVLFETGDVIPADARLISAVNLKTNESSLTGESIAVEKDAGRLVERSAPIGDRYNMVFAGTHVEYGRGTAIVVETGHRTQMGQIAEMLEKVETGSTPLQRELHDVGKRIVYICILVVLVVFALGMVRGNTFEAMLLFAVSLAVAAIPEGLPAVVTITLATGTRAMAKENAIIRRLPAVETLGSASYICSDKTGTITLNRMKVTNVLLADGAVYTIEDVLADTGGASAEVMKEINLVAALCNDVRKGHEGELLGDSTETAMVEAAELAGCEKQELSALLPRVAEVPFDSDRKMMTTVHREDGSCLVLTKGAVESILDRSTMMATPEGEMELTSGAIEKILSQTAGLASRALRTIGVAYRRLPGLPEPFDPNALEKDLVFLGAFAMKDPPRPEVMQALETCRMAHIDVAMITGDHSATAEAVGREISLIKEGARLVEGRELEEMSAEELAEQVDDIGVYARVSPRHKVKIVEALQSQGHVVAMTGDGVNDAPALMEADIGVAMGITGTDVSKEASDMVLADDNFATIVAAVRQGRIIFSNLKKFIYYLLSGNISEVLTIVLAILLGWPLPLVPAMILWSNLVTDGPPALALGMEPAEAGVMEHPPRAVDENILSLPRQGRLLWQGAILTAGALTSFALSHYWLGYAWEKSAGLEMSQTVVFTTVVLSEVFHSYNWRSETRSFFNSPPWENRYLLGALLASVSLQMLVLYAPFMQKAFRTHAPSMSAWILILACSLIPVLVIDRIKVLLAKRGQRGA